MGLFTTFGSFLGPVGTLVGHGLDLVGNAVIGGISQNAANNRDDEIRNQQHEWMVQENAKDRAWQSEEARLARQSAQLYESQEWDRRQAYMHPALQAQRLISAGVNPAGLDGSAAGQAVSSPSAPSNQASGSHAVGNAAGADSGILTAGYTNINRLFDSANKLADLAKKTQEMPYFRDFIQAQIRNLNSAANKSQADADFTDFMNKVNAIVGHHRYSDFEIRKWEAELNKLRSSADLDDEKIVTERTEQFLNEVKRWCTAEEFKKLKIEAQHWDEKVRTDIAYQKAATRERETASSANVASAASSYQQAHYFRALAHTEDSMREWKVMYQRFAAEHKMEESSRAWETHHAAILSDLTRMEREGLINDKLQQDIIKARYDNDWKEVSKLLGYAEQISSIALKASLAGKNIKEMLPSSGMDSEAQSYLNTAVYSTTVGGMPVP